MRLSLGRLFVIAIYQRVPLMLLLAGERSCGSEPGDAIVGNERMVAIKPAPVQLSRRIALVLDFDQPQALFRNREMACTSPTGQARTGFQEQLLCFFQPSPKQKEAAVFNFEHA